MAKKRIVVVGVREFGGKSVNAMWSGVDHGSGDLIGRLQTAIKGIQIPAAAGVTRALEGGHAWLEGQTLKVAVRSQADAGFLELNTQVVKVGAGRCGLRVSAVEVGVTPAAGDIPRDEAGGNANSQSGLRDLITRTTSLTRAMPARATNTTPRQLRIPRRVRTSQRSLRGRTVENAGDKLTRKRKLKSTRHGRGGRLSQCGRIYPPPWSRVRDGYAGDMSCTARNGRKCRIALTANGPAP
jgi:hypothetical protein